MASGPRVAEYVDVDEHKSRDSLEAEMTCRYCFRPATTLLRDMPLCATHMRSFVRHLGGAAQFVGVSPAPVRRAADKHFLDGEEQSS